MKRLLVASALALIFACAPPQTATQSAAPSASPAAPVKVDAPSGDYTIDKSHASLIFRVSHLGFSNYTARFSKFDAKLHFDPANPSSSTVEATIDPASLGLENPPAGFLKELLGDKFLDAKKFPTMTFKSTNVEVTGADTARITGDFTMHGVTKPVVLNAKFNGGWPGMMMDPHARVGFSADGVLKRAEFAIGYGVPAPGTTMGVSDEVHFMIEAEFTGPKWTPPPPSSAPSTAP
jgi:polyisoprenoid-binding protein YceI